MEKNIVGMISISLLASALLMSGCGSSSSDNSVQVQVAEVTKNFQDYSANAAKWKEVETLFGPDPAIEPALSVAHGTGKLFRTIYISPVDAQLENGIYSDGTMFVKELRVDDNGEPGTLAGATTVMMKESGAWKYLKLNPSLSEIQAMGTSVNDEVESVAGCVGCHSQANESDDFTFPPTNHNMMDENKVLQDFLGYETSPAWTLVDTTRGQDAAGTLFGGKHGFDKNLFRKTYKKQLGSKIDGEYPAGTIFLKELSMPDATDDTKAGNITGPLTMMVKRSSGSASTNNWEYFMTDANRTTIAVQGQLNNPDASPENNVSGCISCHSIAQTRDSNNDFIFKKSDGVIQPIPNTQIDAAAVIQRVGCSATFCHGEKLTGVGGNGISLSTLSDVYIKDQLTKFKNGERSGGTMPGIAGGLSEEEIDALANYIPTIQ